MKWNQEYEIGVPVLDAQHRELFEKVEALLEAVRAKSSDKASAVFDFMRNYTALHFRDEEAAMASAGYPDLQAHADEHAGFAKRLQDMERDHAMLPESPWLTLKLAVELGHWLRDHVLSRDHAFGEYLQRRPAAAATTARPKPAIGPAGLEPAPGSPQRAF